MSLSTFLLICAASGIPEETPATEAAVRSAIERSVPYIEERGAWWIEKKKCASCHRVNTMLWSLSAAQKKGFEVSDRYDEWKQWTVDSLLADNDKGVTVGLNNKEGVAQLLLGLPGIDADGVSGEQREKLRRLLLQDQQDDGAWKAGGQLPSQKRDKSETNLVSTQWLALSLMAEADFESLEGTLWKALTRIDGAEPGASTESYVLNLLLAVRREDAPATREFAHTLQQLQNDDGGWGWIAGEDSDALRTGMALYALAQSSIADAGAMAQAQQFLLKSQRDDGTWAVKGTKANRKDKVQETSVYWGTTWAVLGLCSMLPDSET